MLVFQAIRDGVIEASLDHENGWMQSKDTSDIYATRQDHTQCQSFQIF
jgi:26S proteasome regulatory subunit N3